MSTNGQVETFRIQGAELVDRLRRIIHEGNVRRIRVRQDDRVVVELPLTVGVVGAVLAPQLAFIGVLAALLTNCTVEVERIAPPAPPAEEPVEEPAGQEPGVAGIN